MPIDDDGASGPVADSRMVRDTVIRWVLRGDARPGDAIPGDVLASLTGAGRLAVREALTELAELGMVTESEGGAVVAHPRPSDMAEVDEVRHMLEEVAVRRFVANASDAQLGALGRALGELERVVAEDPAPEELMRARDWFFVVMLRGTGSTGTIALLQGLRVQAGLVMSLAVTEPGSGAEIAAELREIYSALAARDARRAIAACDRHRARITEAGLRRIALCR
ncbi:GntR family transcriptional regulator [Amycolatopsis pigmentata]|uniref:GntR family transcriptional regulator n=1 Tax=Amycolatopsis pigmentata TaxID=450801 RepID=A0ABW5G0C5_9PSEU